MRVLRLSTLLLVAVALLDGCSCRKKPDEVPRYDQAKSLLGR